MLMKLTTYVCDIFYSNNFNIVTISEKTLIEVSEKVSVIDQEFFTL